MKQEIKDYIADAVITKVLEGYTYIDNYGNAQHQEGIIGRRVGETLYRNYGEEIKKIVDNLFTTEKLTEAINIHLNKKVSNWGNEKETYSDKLTTSVAEAFVKYLTEKAPIKELFAGKTFTIKID